MALSGLYYDIRSHIYLGKAMYQGDLNLGLSQINSYVNLECCCLRPLGHHGRIYIALLPLCKSPNVISSRTDCHRGERNIPKRPRSRLNGGNDRIAIPLFIQVIQEKGTDRNADDQNHCPDQAIWPCCVISSG